MPTRMNRRTGRYWSRFILGSDHRRPAGEPASLFMVPSARLELAQLSPLPPQDSVSTNFTTTAVSRLSGWHEEPCGLWLSEPLGVYPENAPALLSRACFSEWITWSGSGPRQRRAQSTAQALQQVQASRRHRVRQRRQESAL